MIKKDFLERLRKIFVRVLRIIRTRRKSREYNSFLYVFGRRIRTQKQTLSIFFDYLKIFTFSSYEKVLVLCGKSLMEFSSNIYVLRLPESGKMLFTKVSVCPASVDTITFD